MTKILVLILIIFLSSCANQKYITLDGQAYHTDRSRDWNENNNIRGIEIELSEKYSIEAHRFDNSFGNPSWLANVSVTIPIEGVGTGKYFSMKYGIADGYGNGIFPFFMPTFIQKFEYLKVELVGLPMVFILIIKVPF